MLEMPAHIIFLISFLIPCLVSHFVSTHSIVVPTRLDLKGVGLIYLMLQSATWLLSKKFGIKGLKMGQYGNPPSVKYWYRQAAVYVLSITTMKFLVVALFAIWPGMSSIGDWLLSWTTIENGEAAQVILYVDPTHSLRSVLRHFSSVMGIFPLVMNVLQFWLIDSIVKASTSSTAVRAASPRNSDSQDREPLFNSTDDDDDVLPRDIENGSQTSTSRTTSEGDIKTLVGTETDKTKLLPSGSSSPMTLPITPVVVAHDYPPNTGGSVSSQSSTRSRHKFNAAIGDVAVFEAWEKGEWEERVDGEGRSRRSEQNLGLSGSSR